MLPSAAPRTKSMGCASCLSSQGGCVRDTGRGAPLLLSECHLWSENTGSTRLPHLPWFAFVVLINKMGVSFVCFLSFYDLRAHGPGA